MKSRLRSPLRYLRQVLARGCDGGLSDAQLLQRFAGERDEAAFEVLVWRHGAMVLGVAERVLRNHHDAEDVLQATFLALARQARSIGRGMALPAWLYRVAYRVALRARTQRPKQASGAIALEDVPATFSNSEGLSGELLSALDEELHRLPNKYSVPLILSYLEGLTNQEIAMQMACPIGTIFTRLARGRDLLRKRLTRRGVTFGASAFSAALIPAAQAGVPAGLAHAAVRAALAFAASSASVASFVSPQVIALAEGAAKMIRLARLKLIAATLLAVTAAGSGAGILAFHELATGPAKAPEARITDPFDPAVRPRAQGLVHQDAAGQKNQEIPAVVQVYPKDGATEVEAVTEIRIRFDRPMKQGNACLGWSGDEGAGFRQRGDIRYSEATREFVFPLELAPGRKHEVTLNREWPTGFDGFESEQGVAAKPYRWSFATKQPAAKEGKPVQVISIVPASDSEVALLAKMEVSFDQPMDPSAYGLSVPSAEDRAGLTDAPQLVAGRTEYNAQQRRFTLWISLPPNWNGELRLERFRSKEGVAAQPVTLKYRTLRTVLAEAQVKQVQEAGRSAELRQLVERVRRARRNLRSVSEDVITTSTYRVNPWGWYQQLETKASHFQIATGDRFLGVIDSIMHTPFRMGSDGKVCWLQGGNERIELPLTEAADKHVLLCDAFDAAGAADSEGVIRDLKLEYLGETTVRGRRCYRVRSWVSPLFCEWSIDAATLLPIRLAAVPFAFTLDYTQTRVNQPIPDEEFRAPKGLALRAVAPEPLNADYTRRFLTVTDGTNNGRMSVRLGMKGPKGTKSSGLN